MVAEGDSMARSTGGAALRPWSACDGKPRETPNRHQDNRKATTPR